MITPKSGRSLFNPLRMLLFLLLATAAQSLAESLPLPDPSTPCAISRQLAKGKFLVASRDLLDPNFHETVVLLADFGENGASGLVINRPTRVTLADLLPGEEWLRPRNDTIYLGGPVARDRLILLIRSAKEVVGAHALFDDVYISGSASTLRGLTGGDADARFRAYMGYSGWGPGQLESEVERGDWRVLPAEADAIFEHPARSIWQKLIERSAGEWAFTDGQTIPPGHRGRAEDDAGEVLWRQHLAPTRVTVQKGPEERVG